MFELTLTFKISDFTYKTLFIDFPKEDFPGQVLKELYKMRWSIEKLFKELKYNVGLASIHSKKQKLIFQEVFSKLIMYNFVPLISYHVKSLKNKELILQKQYIFSINILRISFRKRYF